MTTRQRANGSAPLPDDLTAAIAIAIWKEAHELTIDTTPEFVLSPGELHGMPPQLSGHLGKPMLKRAHRRHEARGELRLAQ